MDSTMRLDEDEFAHVFDELNDDEQLKIINIIAALRSERSNNSDALTPKNGTDAQRENIAERGERGGT